MKYIIMALSALVWAISMIVFIPVALYCYEITKGEETRWQFLKGSIISTFKNFVL